MFRQIEIENFRGIERLALDDLRRINLFVGRNNSGKTTVLEAVFLLCGGADAALPTRLARLRGQPRALEDDDAVWRPLFHRFDSARPIEVRGRWSVDDSLRRLVATAAERSAGDEAGGADIGSGIVSTANGETIGGLRLHYFAGGAEPMESFVSAPPTPSDARPRRKDSAVRSTFLSARSQPGFARDAMHYSVLVKSKQEQDVLEAVRLVEPAVQRIEVLSEAGGPDVYVDVGLEALVPLAACGDGFVRLFSIVLELIGCRGGVLLVDEIDDGLHHSVLGDVWRLLGELSRRHDVQIFATTHDDELLQSAIEAFKDDAQTLGLFRIDRRGSGHAIASYDAQSQQAILASAFEVRG